MLAPFLENVELLGEKLGPVLIQLPPRLAFDIGPVTAFFDALRHQFPGTVVCEPRHRSWFTIEVEALMDRFMIVRVAADPALLPEAAQPGGWKGLLYFRLHGSPEIYHSVYREAYLKQLATQIKDSQVPVWCIFDNTASGAAVGNALDLKSLLK